MAKAAKKGGASAPPAAAAQAAPAAAAPALNVSTLGMKIGGLRVDPATGGEPPLIPAPAPAPPAPVDAAAEREVRQCLDVLEGRLLADPVLRAEMAAFDGAAWTAVARGVIRAEAAGRWAQVSLAGESQVELGSLAWTGSKRIPL